MSPNLPTCSAERSYCFSPHDHTAMPMPRAKRCACGTKIPDLCDHCPKCNHVCPCGRRIVYPGRGRPPRRCPQCAELRRDRQLCPCGKLLLKSQRSYCSMVCAKEARRVRAGAQPRAGWLERMATALDDDRRHAWVARVVAAWLRFHKQWEVWEHGTAIIFPRTRIKWEARQTDLRFAGAADLPPLVPIDDHMRMDSLLTVNPPVRGYILANARLDAVAITRVDFGAIATFTRRRCWIARYGDYDWELLCPTDSMKVQSLRVDADL